MAKEISGYDLSRKWFDFCFENPEKINPNHSAIFFFAIEHCNRLGWKEKFGFPTQMTMDAIGIKKHQTYIKYFNELVEWGFFVLVQKSTNQYSANIISLGNGMPKNGKALDKAFIKHGAKQTQSNGQSTGQSNSSINKQLTKEQTISVCDFANRILKDFSFNEVANFDKLRIINTFLNLKVESGLFDYFTNQYLKYQEYKKLSGERRHNFTSFFGNQSNRFEDGKWDEANWEQRINDFKKSDKKVLANEAGLELLK